MTTHNDLPRTSERGETSSLFITSYETTIERRVQLANITRQRFFSNHGKTVQLVEDISGKFVPF